MKIRSFTKLIVWQKAHQLVIEIYKISENFPKTECFGLTQQIRRAAVSISSNIAEGFSNFYKKDKIKFYNISLGSNSEIQNQILIAKSLKYIKKKDFDKIAAMSNEVLKLLYSIIKRTKSTNN